MQAEVPAAQPGDKANEAGESFEQQHEHPPTSRICIKNLPKYVDERRLREHFAAKGEVTDAKVMRTRDGKSRCFGFVGFRTPEEAQAALKYFNKSFMDTMRLVVEFAYKLHSAEGPRAWSKYTAGTSANKRVEKTGANGVPLGDGGADGGRKGGKGRKKEPLPEEEDPKLREFMQIMQPRSKQAIWTNDDMLPPGAARAAGAPGVGPAGTQQQARGAGGTQAVEGGSDDEYEELPLGAGAAATPSSSEGGGGSGSGSEGSEEEEEEAEQQQGDGVVRNAALSDLDYLRSRVSAAFGDDDEAFAAGAARGAGAPGSHGGSEEEGSEASAEEEGESEGEGEGEEEAGEASGSEGDEQQQRRQRGAQPEAAAGGTQQGRRKGAAPAADELDAIFGGGQAGDDAASDEADGDGSGEEAEDSEMADASEGEEEAEEDGAAAGEPSGSAAVFQAGDEASIGETGRLFVRNLPYTATETDLQQLFEQHGDVSEVHLVLDRASKKSKGFALVQFADPQDAVRAHTELDGSIFQGRLIHILPGKRPPPPPEAPAGEGDAEGGAAKVATSSYKEQKEAALKATAGNRSAWNTLFMRADTVAEAVAAHFGVSKSELLDREAGDMAVRMALGETHVIAETKRALAEAGADVSKLESAAAAGGKAAATRGVARSDSVLVVKNLPYSASEQELETMFGALGALGRLVLPPTRTLALVEYLEPQDARRAFKALAYKRYQHVPLYLEWAPKGLFSSPPPARPAPGAGGGAAAPAAEAATGGAKGKKAKAAGELLTAEAQADDVESSSIFVKNLAWGTGEEALKAHFDAAVSGTGGSVRSVKVARRKGPDGKTLSAGFGFVECSSEAAAKAAVKSLQGSALDGHKLVLQLSTKKGGAATTAGAADAAGKGKAKLPDTSKVVVRNVAFEATRKDILGLFTPFGAVKSCRLPRKFDGTHRGFAFVDFATKQEARNAMEAVQGAHLYGRRLVLEWAEEEGGLDELRAKTAAKYRGEEGLDEGPEPTAPAAADPKQQQQTKKKAAAAAPAEQRQKKRQRK